jgi:hypothetical protein
MPVHCASCRGPYGSTGMQGTVLLWGGMIGACMVYRRRRVRGACANTSWPSFMGGIESTKRRRGGLSRRRCHWRFFFKLDPSSEFRSGRGTGVIPAKDSYTRIKTLALASSHGRYITVTTERTLFSIGEWPLYITGINL